MGKKNREREEKRQQEAAKALKALAKRPLAPIVPEHYQDFKEDCRGRVSRLHHEALRAPEDWVCKTKSRREDRRFLDLVTFTFARYRVPNHLLKSWLFAPPQDLNFHHWYVIATQGRSLYKEASRACLSKLETHHFLTAPVVVPTAQRALWYAIARAHVDKQDVAQIISQTKMVNARPDSEFWRSMVHFFARNPSSVREIDDLIDYISAMRQEDEAYSVKGRTLTTLRRGMEEWHRALAKAKSIGGGTWEGMPLPDINYKRGKDDRRALWKFVQIKTGHDLFREGQRMHHCVGSYKHECMQGHISIWSLTYEYPIGQLHRGLTIEVTKDGRIVQARGYANRYPMANERKMVEFWAKEHGLVWDRITFCGIE